MKELSDIDLQSEGATYSFIKLLSNLNGVLWLATDLEGAFNQAAKLLEAGSKRKCEGISLWVYQSKPRLAVIQRGKCCNYLNNDHQQPATEKGCWTEGESLAARIHRKKGKDIIIEDGESLNDLVDRKEVDTICIPVKVGDNMALCVTARPYYSDKLVLQEEFMLLGSVSMLLKQWIELRFDPREILRSREKQSIMVPSHQGFSGKTFSLEEMLIHRIGEMVTVLASDSLVEKGLHGRVIGLVEKSMIRWALSRTNMVQVDAAKILGINRNTLHAKMKLYGLLGRK